MRYGIPIIGDRVAPRCIYAEGLLVISISRRKVSNPEKLSVPISSAVELLSLLRRSKIDTVICGGVSQSVREMLHSEGIEIIDNVTGNTDPVVANLYNSSPYYTNHPVPPTDNGIDPLLRRSGYRSNSDTTINPCPPDPDSVEMPFNCLNCSNKICLLGANCVDTVACSSTIFSAEDRRIVEATLDISHEEPRRLCRLAELVYFSIEMNYKRIGVAFCVEMWEPAQILYEVLSRFFEVVPVCCKIGGIDEGEFATGSTKWKEANEISVACNPIGQAVVLNHSGTHFNVAMGLCVGADALFSMNSEAPTSTLFVKDKSLANNPIGALYSEYYLHDAVLRGQKQTVKERNDQEKPETSKIVRKSKRNNRREDRS